MKQEEGEIEHVADDVCLELFVHIVEILRMCGVSDGRMTSSLNEAVVRARRPMTELRRLHSSPEFHLSCCDVVYRWRTDADFVDDHGEPRRLVVRGEGRSFEALLAPYMPSRKVDKAVDYLEALGVVVRIGTEHVELVAESALACSGQAGASIAPEVVVGHLSDVISTLNYNLADKGSNTSGRFERACYRRIPVDYVPILHRLVEERGQNFVDGIDEWLGRHEVRDSTSDAAATAVVLAGAGAYAFVRRRPTGGQLTA